MLFIKKGLYMNEKIKLSVCAVIICDGSLLIVKRCESDNFLPGVWEFPGGGVEAGEAVKDALVRELKEEINVDVSAENMRLIGISEEFTKQKESKHDIQFNYEIELNEKPIISLSSEHTKFDWIYKCDERIDDFLRDILKQSDSCKKWLE